MIRFAENLNKMIAAGLGGAMEAPRTEVAVGHHVRYMDASGPVATFETNIAAPIRSLRVDMQPIQDLHGQDAPYPAGGGKNLLSVNLTSQTTSGVTITVNDDGTMVLSGKASAYIFFNLNYVSGNVAFPAGSYLLNGGLSLKGFSMRVYDSGDKLSEGGGASDIPFTIPSNTTGNYVRIDIETGTTFNNVTIKPMVRLSTVSDATFAPYSNICPISGRDSVTVWREASYDPSADPALTIQLGTTVYGGTLDVSTGKLTVTHGEIASYNGEALPGEWISDRDVYAAGTSPTIGAQVVYVLDTPQTIDLDPQQIMTLKGTNNVWSNSGDVTLEYPYYEETEGY